jgi:hypothetical protein
MANGIGEVVHDGVDMADYERRVEELTVLQEHYQDFETFCEDAMWELWDWKITEQQRDITRFVAMDIQLLMLQAQREQAKSTIAALLAVWTLIMRPTARITIVSAASPLSKQIAAMIRKTVKYWDILECLVPDVTKGDRDNTEMFDVNGLLKGVDKTPSVLCIGIGSNFQGIRSDLLIPDDIESMKNSLTAAQRATLLNYSKDFSSICQKGKILYLGTPQTKHSIYKTLSKRGYAVRIYPGRFPTVAQEPNYGGLLAPRIMEIMRMDPSVRTGGGMSGKLGKPTDPDRVSERTLRKIEEDQGYSFFSLQFMLDTSDMDAERYPLKTKDLIVCPLNLDKAYEEYVWLPVEEKRLDEEWELFEVHKVGGRYLEYAGKMIFVDPAGGRGKDEISVTCSAFLNGYIFVLRQKNWHGYNTVVFREIAEFVLECGVRLVVVEENMDRGSFGVLLSGELKEIEEERKDGTSVRIENHWETQNKEGRIIGTLEPLLGRHKLIVSTDVVEEDRRSREQYNQEERAGYSVFFQMSNITMDRGCLVVDDRLDSLSGSVSWWNERLKTGVRMSEEAAIMQLIADKVGKKSVKRGTGRLKGLWGGNYGGGNE